MFLLKKKAILVAFALFLAFALSSAFGPLNNLIYGAIGENGLTFDKPFKYGIGSPGRDLFPK